MICLILRRGLLEKKWMSFQMSLKNQDIFLFQIGFIERWHTLNNTGTYNKMINPNMICKTNLMLIFAYDGIPVYTKTVSNIWNLH